MVACPKYHICDDFAKKLKAVSFVILQSDREIPKEQCVLGLENGGGWHDNQAWLRDTDLV